MHFINKPDSEAVRMVLESTKYRHWRQRLESHGNKILQLDVLSVISRKHGTWYAAFLDCLLLTPEGNRITRCLTLRGESVVVIPLLRCIEDNKLYTIMVEQRCINDGSLCVTFPAGGVDNGENFRVMACQELKEETGLEISPDDMVELSKGITLNASLSDDLICFYGFRKDVNRTWLDSIDNRSGGLHAEGEHIRVRVFSLSDCFKMSTASTLIGLALIYRTFGITV